MKVHEYFRNISRRFVVSYTVKKTLAVFAMIILTGVSVKAQTGFLEISSVPEHAMVFLNSSYYGLTNGTVELGEGIYQLKLVYEGCDTLIMPLNITRHLTTQANLTLKNCDTLLTIGKEPVPAEEEEEITDATEIVSMPEYPGGLSKLITYISQNLQMPPGAKKAGISGKVIVNFKVNKDGSISDAKIVQGLGYGCDEEALRLVNGMPDWIPAKASDGRDVPVTYNLPVHFR